MRTICQVICALVATCIVPDSVGGQWSRDSRGKQWVQPTPDEREAAALAKPAWTARGKIDPRVYSELEQQSLRDRQPGARIAQAVRPAGFKGLIYVAIHLHPDSGKEQTPNAVRDVQARVLSRLTAAEFSLRYAFKQQFAMLGYASAEAVAKLGRDPDVAAIGIEDGIPPKDRPREQRGQAPASELRQMGEVKLEPAVQYMLQRSPDGLVFVTVVTTQCPLEPGTDQELTARLRRQDTCVNEVQYRILSTLTAAEFRVTSKGVGSLYGFANASALSKLEQHSDVIMIALAGPPAHKAGSMVRKK